FVKNINYPKISIARATVSMYKKLITIVSLICFSSIASADTIDDLRWISQDYKPYGFLDNNGKNAGQSIELVEKIMKKLGSQKNIQDIEIHKFSKWFIRRNDDKNTVFFPLAKLPAREKYFKWVGPIGMDEPVLYAKKERGIIIRSSDDLKKYSIATIEGYYAIDELRNLGIDNIQTSDNYESNISKLNDNKIDLVLCNRLSCMSAIESLNMNVNDYNIVYSLETHELSMAFNKDTDDNIINQVKMALDSINK
ncbi:MAG: transporter substrate-binding domain-containing protein, partial [Pseudomonadota bacterium]